MARGRKGLGVEPLKETIRLKFTLSAGERVAETLAWTPTPGNLARAKKLAMELRRDIEAGALSDERYRYYFPDSRRIAKPSDARTFHDFVELFLAVISDKSANTRGQYRNALRWWERQLGGDTPMGEIRALAAEGTLG